MNKQEEDRYLQGWRQLRYELENADLFIDCTLRPSADSVFLYRRTGGQWRVAHSGRFGQEDEDLKFEDRTPHDALMVMSKMRQSGRLDNRTLEKAYPMRRKSA